VLVLGGVWETTEKFLIIDLMNMIKKGNLTFVIAYFTFLGSPK
jgi:hypothetical protein